MIRRRPKSTRNDTLLPNTTHVRSGGAVGHGQLVEAEGGAVALPVSRAVEQHEVREVEVEVMGRHIGAAHHEAHVAEGAGIDHRLVVGPVDAVELAGRRLVDQVEEARKGIAEIEAAPAAVADVEDALALRVQLLPFIEVRIVPLSTADRRVGKEWVRTDKSRSSAVP